MENVLICLLTGGCGAAGVKMIETLVVWFLNRRAKKSDDEADAEKQKEQAKEAEFEEVVKTVESLKSADKLIMLDRIKYLCRSYLDHGEVEFSDLTDLIEMHSCYHDLLGGNGNLDTLMELVKELPIKK